jgi:hypothetical protein
MLTVTKLQYKTKPTKLSFVPLRVCSFAMVRFVFTKPKCRISQVLVFTHDNHDDDNKTFPISYAVMGIRTRQIMIHHHRLPLKYDLPRSLQQLYKIRNTRFEISYLFYAFRNKHGKKIIRTKGIRQQYI